MATDPSAPTTERGTLADPANITAFNAKPYGWSRFVSDSMEHVPELQWQPNGGGLVAVYHMMRGDAQVQGLYLASTLPVRRYTYHFEPNSAREEIITKWARDYNIPIKGQEDKPRGRMKNRFKHLDHQRHAFLAILYGHMFMEQYGTIGPDGKWHVRKLGPRMPSTIREIRVDKDGGLRSIVQNTRNNGGMVNLTPAWMAGSTEIKINRLLAYVWEQEGGDWTGRSMLRGIYKNWLMKDRVLRVGAINIERAGGVPIVRAPRGALKSDMNNLSKMAQQFKVGEDAGGAIPHDAELILAQAAGGADAVEYVKLMNEEMGRGWLLMFMNLGQTTSGSRALGGSQMNFALNAHETIAGWYCDTFNEHQLEDDAEWNYQLADDETVPFLSYSRNDDSQLAIKDLVSAIDSGLVVLDEGIRSWFRDLYRMPRQQEEVAAPQTSPESAQAERGAEASRGPSSPVLGRSAARSDMNSLYDLGIAPDLLKAAVEDQLAEIFRVKK